MKRAVFLDRDGVLWWEHDGSIVEDAGEACRLLREAGFVLICVTNQPDVARGRMQEAAIAETNSRMAATLGLDAVYACPHDDPDGCKCRKPLPGMLLRAAAEWRIDLRASYMIGDRWKDIDAGHAAGCRAILVDRGLEGQAGAPPEATVGSTLDAARWVIADAQALS